MRVSNQFFADNCITIGTRHDHCLSAILAQGIFLKRQPSREQGPVRPRCLMAAVEEPSKPQSAYFLYINASRAVVQKELGETAFGPVTKAQAERWKTMAAGDKAKYEKQAAELKAKYEKDLAAYKEAGGVVGQKRQEKKDAKKAKADKAAKKAAKKDANADRPKRPAGGAFGAWLNKNRADIQKSLPAGSPCTAVAPVANAKWKAMSEAEKAPFEKEYLDLKAKYEEDFKVWKDAKGATAEAEGDKEEEGEGEEAEKESGKEASPKTPSPKKRGKPDSKPEEVSPSAKEAKRGKAKGAASPPGPAIDAKVITQATKLGMDGALKNLAARKEVSHLSAEKLLTALQESGGLVNKARAALLGA